MEKIVLRKMDFLTGIILMFFGVWLVFESLKMPMKDSHAGVINVWYVSPALFPLIVAVSIILMALALCRRAIKDGGAGRLLADIRRLSLNPSEGTTRFFAIVLVICVYVYLMIPRIDFFLSTTVCLFVFTSFFYLDDRRFLKRLLLFYLAGSLVITLLYLTGAAKTLTTGYRYAMDLVVFLFLICYALFGRYVVRGDIVQRKRLKTTVIVSLVVPLILVPSFMYLLLVPMPTEGLIIELMNMLRYSFR